MQREARRSSQDDPVVLISQTWCCTSGFIAANPHPTCLYPGVKQHVQDTLGSLDPRVQRKVLYETAERVYNLNVSG